MPVLLALILFVTRAAAQPLVSNNAMLEDITTEFFGSRVPDMLSLEANSSGFTSLAKDPTTGQWVIMTRSTTEKVWTTVFAEKEEEKLFTTFTGLPFSARIMNVVGRGLYFTPLYPGSQGIPAAAYKNNQKVLTLGQQLAIDGENGTKAVTYFTSLYPKLGGGELVGIALNHNAAVYAWDKNSFKRITPISSDGSSLIIDRDGIGTDDLGRVMYTRSGGSKPGTFRFDPKTNTEELFMFSGKTVLGRNVWNWVGFVDRETGKHLWLLWTGSSGDWRKPIVVDWSSGEPKEVLSVPFPIQGFQGVFAVATRNYNSQVTALEVYTTSTSPYADAIGVRNGDTYEFLIKQNDPLPNGRRLGLNGALLVASIGCDAYFVSKDSAGTPQGFYRARKSCIEKATVQADGNVVLDGKNFLAGGATGLTVFFGSTQVSPITSSNTRVTFKLPSTVGGNIPVLVKGVLTSNAVTLVIDPSIFIKPAILTSIGPAVGTTGPLSPGSLFSIKGTNLAGVGGLIPGVSLTLTRPWPTEIGRCKVYVDGTPVPLQLCTTFPDGTSQATGQFPVSLAVGPHTVRIERLRLSDGAVEAVSNTLAFSVNPLSPIILPREDLGGSLLENSGLPVNGDNPVGISDTLVAIGTGFGALNVPIPEGLAGSDIIVGEGTVIRPLAEVRSWTKVLVGTDWQYFENKTEARASNDQVGKTEVIIQLDLPELSDVRGSALVIMVGGEFLPDITLPLKQICTLSE